MFDKKTILIIIFLLIGGVETSDCDEWYLKYPTKFECEENVITTKSITSTTTSTTSTEYVPTLVPTYVPTMVPTYVPTISPMTLPPPSEFPTTEEYKIETIVTLTTTTTTTNSARRHPWWLSLWAIVSYAISGLFILVGFGVTIILKIRRRQFRITRQNRNAEETVQQMDERRQLIDESDDDEEIYNSNSIPSRNNRESVILNHEDSDATLVPPPSSSENVTFESESSMMASKTVSSTDSSVNTTIRSNQDVPQSQPVTVPASSSENLASPVRPVLPSPQVSSAQGPTTSTPTQSAVLRSVEETEPTVSPLNKFVQRVRNQVRKRGRSKSDENISDSVNATRVQPKRKVKKNINYNEKKM